MVKKGEMARPAQRRKGPGRREPGADFGLYDPGLATAHLDASFAAFAGDTRRGALEQAERVATEIWNTRFDALDEPFVGMEDALPEPFMESDEHLVTLGGGV